MKTPLLLAALLSVAIPVWSSPDDHSEHSCIVIPDQGDRLPKAVIHVIIDSNEGTFARNLFCEQDRDPYKSAPLRGVRVTLANSGGATSYLVRGYDTMMTGADNTWYWFVEQSGDSAKILLYVGTGCVQIESKATRGYRNIWTRWQTGDYATVREFRWNGHTYRLFREYNDRNVW